jgi:hypothetical protein
VLEDQSSRPYEAEGAVVLVEHVTLTDFLGVPRWPFEDVRLADAVDSDEGEIVLVGDAGLTVLDTIAPGFFVEEDRAFRVEARPLLPYEEHFPEFEGAP